MYDLHERMLCETVGLNSKLLLKFKLLIIFCFIDRAISLRIVREQLKTSIKIANPSVKI